MADAIKRVTVTFTVNLMTCDVLQLDDCCSQMEILIQEALALVHSPTILAVEDVGYGIKVE